MKASLGEDVTDQKAFAGMVRESVTYNGTEAKPLSKTVNVPWQSEPTASRTINNDTVHARYTGTRVVHTGEAVGTNWRVGRSSRPSKARTDRSPRCRTTATRRSPVTRPAR